ETRFEYDDLDHPSSTTYPDNGPLNNVETFFYDPLGNLLSETDRAGQTLTYHYSTRGHVSSVNRSQAPYGARNDLARTFRYDANGNLRSETDWSGIVTVHEYNELNQPSISKRAGMQADEEHDFAGQLLSSIDFRPSDQLDSAGVKTTFVYDC